MNEIENALDRIKDLDIEYAHATQEYRKVRANLIRKLGEAYLKELAL